MQYVDNRVQQTEILHTRAIKKRGMQDLLIELGGRGGIWGPKH